jgi:hypothetical protein
MLIIESKNIKALVMRWISKFRAVRGEKTEEGYEKRKKQKESLKKES